MSKQKADNQIIGLFDLLFFYKCSLHQPYKPKLGAQQACSLRCFGVVQRSFSLYLVIA